jgi:hypothetical protein
MGEGAWCSGGAPPTATEVARNMSLWVISRTPRFFRPPTPWLSPVAAAARQAGAAAWLNNARG